MTNEAAERLLREALAAMLVTYQHDHWDVAGSKYCDRCLTNEQARAALAAAPAPTYTEVERLDRPGNRADLAAPAPALNSALDAEAAR